MLSYKDRVVVITGAGHGIGRSHALAFGRRAGRVVVNDIDRAAAEEVVAEIAVGGGAACVNSDSVVEGADRIVDAAIARYGRIDVLINNAGVGVSPPEGIVIDEMPDGEWQRLLDIHLGGTFRCTRAAFAQMKNQGYGRILMTASPVGFFGAHGASHYSAAKAAIFALMQCLSLEGREYNVSCHALSPVAASEMTRVHFPRDWMDVAHASYVSELAVWLAHERCTTSGTAFEVGGGYIHPIRYEMADGLHLTGSDYTAENIARLAEKLADFDHSIHPHVGQMDIVVNKIFDTLAQTETGT